MGHIWLWHYVCSQLVFHCYCLCKEKSISKLGPFAHYTWPTVNSLQQNCIHITHASLLLRRFITKGNQIHIPLPLKVVMSTTYSSRTTFTSQTHFLPPEALSCLETVLNLLFPFSSSHVKHNNLTLHWSQSKNGKVTYQQEDAFMNCNCWLTNLPFLSKKYKGQEWYSTYHTSSAVLQCTVYQECVFNWCKYLSTNSF